MATTTLKKEKEEEATLISHFGTVKPLYYDTFEDLVFHVMVAHTVITHTTIMQLTLPPTNLHLHLFLDCRGHRGTTDDFTTGFLHFSLFFTALWNLVNSRPVHSLMLSSQLFFCLLWLLPPFIVPC